MDAPPFKPTTLHNINPFDPSHPFLYIQSFQGASHIRELSIHTAASSAEFRPPFVQFLRHLHALEKLVIHWKALDWVKLEEDALLALVRLFALPSLNALEIPASSNFPLSLFRYITAKKVHIAATTLATAVMPFLPADMWGTRQGSLTHLSLIGAHNIREFRTFMEWQGDKTQIILPSVKYLMCYISWRDQSELGHDPLKDLSSLLLKLSTVARSLEEFRLIDWHGDLIEGRQITPASVVHLTSLKHLSMRYGASLKESPRTMEKMDKCTRDWLLPILSSLPVPQILEDLDLMFSFAVPFPWPVDLHTWMQNLARDLVDRLLVSFFALRKVTLTFDLRGAHTVPFDWESFNNGLHPDRLQQRGVECNFKALIYRP